MEDYIVVGRIGAVMVEMPVGCLDMDFYVSDPGYPCNRDSRIEEVGPGVSVVETRIDDLDDLTVCRE